jgi:hypothetical protein
MSLSRLAAPALFLIVAKLPGQTALTAAVGSAFPVARTASSYNAGLSAMLAIDNKPSFAPVGLRLEALLSELKGQDPNHPGSRIVAVVGGVGVRGALNSYALAGAGLYRRSCFGPDCSDDTATHDFGVNGGFGFAAPLDGPVAVLLEARLHVIATEPRRVLLVPVTLGLSF